MTMEKSLGLTRNEAVDTLVQKRTRTYFGNTITIIESAKRFINKNICENMKIFLNKNSDQTVV